MDSNLSLFYLSDIKKLIIKKKYQIILVFFLCFILSFFFFLIRQMPFETTATFYDQEGASRQTVGGLKDLVLTSDYVAMTETMSFFKSKALAKKVSQKLAFQINVLDEMKFYKKLLAIMKDNLKLELNKKIVKQEELEFLDVVYKKDIPSIYFLKFFQNDSFEVLDNNKKQLKTGIIDKQILLEDFSFTLKKIPRVFFNRLIKIQVEPLDGVAKAIQQNLEIKKDQKTSSNFLLLKTKHLKAKVSANILNTLMDIYQEYLRCENETVAKYQLKYLENRKKSLENDLFDNFDDFEKYLNSNVQEDGFVKLDFQINSLIQKKEQFLKELNDLQYRLKFLQNIDFLNFDNNIAFDEDIASLFEKIKSLKAQKNAIAISLEKDFSFKDSINLIAIADEKIEKLLKQKKQIENLRLLLDNKSSLAIDNKIQKFYELKNKDSFFSLLNEKTKLIDEKIALLKQNNFDIDKDLHLDLISIKDRYCQIYKTLDCLKIEKAEIEHVIRNITNSYEITSLTPYLSKDITNNITELSKKLKDENNYTTKEIESIKKLFDLEKKYIISYLNHILELKQINSNILHQNIYSLKEIEKDLLIKEIAFLTNKTKDLISNKKTKILEEQTYIEKKMNTLKTEMKNSIKKLGLEKKINLKSETTRNMIDSLTKLIESKNLDYNLKKINSKPIDLAIVPINPNSPHLLRNSSMAGSVAVFIFLIVTIYVAAIKGFSLSVELIKSLGFEFCGKLSYKCNGIEVEELKKEDLECLRKIIATIDERRQKIITTLSAKGPNFIHYLAALLAIVGKKILVIETQSETIEKNGLFTFLENGLKQLPIQKMQAYDFLPSGDNKYFAFELLKSNDFLQMLEDVKSDYDLILIYSSAKINSAEARIYIEFSDKIILTFKDEIFDDIKVFVDWAKRKTKLGFITY